MGIFEGLLEEQRERMALEVRANPLENPATPLSSPALWQWMTGGEPTASGESITDLTALKISTVYRCVRFISESIASLPLETWKVTATGREKAIDQDVFYLLDVEPNPEMSAFNLKSTWFGSASLTGNGYIQIERNSFGKPVALWPLHPHKTKPVRKNNVLLYETSDGMPLGQTRPIAAADILHLRVWSLDGILGLSPIGLLRESLGLAKASEKFGARFFGNGSRPGGVMVQKNGAKPDPKVQKEIVESWNREHAGTSQGKTAFMFGGEWNYQQIGLSPEDSQFLGTRNFVRADIAAMWGLPPHYAGDTSRMSGNNAEQEGLRVVTDTLRPYLSNGENEIDRKLLPSRGRNAFLFVCRFDVSARVQGDFKTQQEGFAAGVQWGWFSPNDVRRKMGENPGPAELDVYRVPVNMQSAKTLLDTESIQDQPVGANPADLAPTPAERKLYGVYVRTWGALYRKGFRSLYGREKRDSKAIQGTIQPVLRGIADLALSFEGAPAERIEEIASGLVDEFVKGLEKRAAKWPAGLAQELVDDLAGPEFLKAVRSIHINASREVYAARAAREVEENEG